MIHIPVSSPLESSKAAFITLGDRGQTGDSLPLPLTLNSPKAEVTGSNPVGCAIFFNLLAEYR